MAEERGPLFLSARRKGSGEGWSRQRLAEFLAFVSSFTDERSAMCGAVERAAEVLDAEAVSRGGACAVEAPGLGSCVAVAAALEDGQHGQLVLARHDDDGFCQEELDLLGGMARVLALALKMLRALEGERALRERSDELMTAEQLAELLLVRKSTVEDYARRGVFPSLKLGRHRRFVRSDVLRAIDDLRRMRS